MLYGSEAEPKARQARPRRLIASQWRGERAVLAVACVVMPARECREEQQSTALHFKEHAAGMVHTSASARASACLTLALLPAESVAFSLASLILVPRELWAGALPTCRVTMHR